MPAYSAKRPEGIHGYSADPTRILVAFRDHMEGIIWEHDDMSIREARVWVSLLTQRNGTPVAPKVARSRGFQWMYARAEVWTAVQVLLRFQRIARSIEREGK